MAFSETFRWIAAIVVFIVVYYAASMFTIKRNVVKVIKVFEEKNALSAKTAVSIESLGIRKQGFLERAMKRRDNRIHALQFLISAGIVVTNADGMYYLSKKKMAAFRRDGNFVARFIIPPQ
ncbi:MAG: hypothetical protein GX918_00555 [Clostridiales bacterium]|jgi:hypothetical protein|nr:hypothetical protein [Clostridiales bacterium]